MSRYRQGTGLLAVATGLALCSARPALANTYSFVTPPGATVNPGSVLPVDATVTFITALDQITIQITNRQQETYGDEAQAISGIDFHLQGLTAVSLNPTLTGYQGEIGNLNHTPGQNADFVTGSLTYNSNGGSVANLWRLFTTGTQIAGGIQLTALNSANPSRQQLIIGPANSPPNSYIAGSDLRNDSPVLRTNTNTYIQYVIAFTAGSGVTSSTVVDSARMTWNGQFSANTELDLNKVPEPDTLYLLLGGLGALAVRRGARCRRRTNNPS